MDAILKVSLIKINGITLSNNIYYLKIYIEYFIPYFIQFYSWKLCLPIRSLYYKNIFSKLVNTCCNFSSEYESNVWKCLKDLHVLPNIFFLLFKHISKYNYIIIFDSGLKFVEWLNNWIGKVPVVEYIYMYSNSYSVYCECPIPVSSLWVSSLGDSRLTSTLVRINSTVHIHVSHGLICN